VFPSLIGRLKTFYFIILEKHTIYVSIPYRKTKNPSNAIPSSSEILFPSLIGRLKTLPHQPIGQIVDGFPSLIGRLKTWGELGELVSRELFPSLIGRLKTLPSEQRPSKRDLVSIPYRKTKNCDKAGLSLKVSSEFPSLIGRLKT